jgi:N6-L-threonylcarbamoyladenine synthase
MQINLVGGGRGRSPQVSSGIAGIEPDTACAPCYNGFPIARSFPSPLRYGSPDDHGGFLMIVLGIETSCDETAAAVVTDAGDKRILANLVRSQLDEHRPYGGVVPEIAARAHLETLDPLIAGALAEAGLGFADLDGVAFTGGPGLIGGVIVGTMAAKAIALVRGLPLVAVNHLEGHALTARLTDSVAFPYLLLLVSGGHCQLLAVEAVGRYKRLGTTIDDAAGEAFDKSAKLLGLGYPGGPLIERAAVAGDAARFDLPRPMKGRPGCDLSFSGLKTAVRQIVERLTRDGADLEPRDVADLAAALQAAIGDSLVDRTENAIAMFRARHPAGRSLVVAGGVAANRALRSRLAVLAASRDMAFIAPPVALCTDNAAMIAWAGLERLRLGLTDDLAFAPRPRWPLDPDAAPAIGAGVKA